MEKSSFQLILASSSIYRKAMLERFRLPFTTQSPDIDETPRSGESPVDLAIRLSIEKAQAISRLHPGAIVIGSDQVATFDNTPIGKAGSFAKAQQQLRTLSGKEVQFHSALAVTDGKTLHHTNVITYCQFRELNEQEIEHYLSVENAIDTAGSAKAEGLGISLMQSMRSDDPTAIIGLPLIALSRLLREFGINPTLHASLPL